MAMPIRGGGHAPRNDFQTRDVELVISAIAHLLPHDVHIWEPFAGTAACRLSTGLENAGYTVSCTGLPEQDFFETEPPLWDAPSTPATALIWSTSGPILKMIWSTVGRGAVRRVGIGLFSHSFRKLLSCLPCL
jgi:hypothetical protein